MSQTLLIAFMLGLTVSARAADKPATASKPNIIFILRDDIGEKNNLAAKNPAKAKELHAKLAAWRTEVNAIMPTTNPDWTGQPVPKKNRKLK